MKNLFVFLFLFTSLAFAQKNKKSIYGRVSDGRELLPNVSITVDGTGASTFTDEQGYYSIEAAPGEVIAFSHGGLKTVKILVEDVTTVLNPTMAPDVEELDEVVVLGNTRRSQKDLAMEYGINPRIIRTAYGFLDADTAPGNIRFINAEQISPIGLCILDVLRGYFAGVRVVGSCAGATGNFNSTEQITAFGAVFIRGVGSISFPRSAIFDVDGQIFTIPPVWVDVQNMQRIAILNNFATVTQYGSIASGGVVVINTVSGNKSRVNSIDYARLTDNFFDEDELLSGARMLQNRPNYLQELIASESDQQARKTYEQWTKSYSSSPYFVLDAYRYFYDTRSDHGFADSILDANFSSFKNNPVLLKALAYHYEAQKRFKKAHDIYKAVYKLRPRYSQSYIDLVKSYRNKGEMQRAAGIYTRYNYLQDKELITNDTTEFTPIIKREYNNLLSLHRRQIMDVEKASELFVNPEDFFKGTRLVFEWNDGEAEFHLQFVNPEDQYYTFKHTQADNGELIMREKLQGYSTTEFLIDDSLLGTWKVNAKYLGNKSLTPSYLKATVYHNYGTAAQRDEIMVFKLDIKGKYVALFNVSNGSSMVSK